MLTRSAAIRPAVIALCAVIALLAASLATAPAALASQSAGQDSAGTLPPGAALALARELEQAWQITKGSGVLVAVLSTGVDPVGGLAGKVVKGPDYAPVASPVLTDGTVLASLIAASGPTTASPVAPVGRAPGARILSERIVAYGSGAQGTKYQQDGTWQQIEAEAIRYAVNHGAKVIAIFESGTSAGNGLAAAVAYAVAKKVVVVTSSSYFGKGAEVFPDDLPGVINVSGTLLPGAPAPSGKLRYATDRSILVTAPANLAYATGPGGGTYTAWGNYPMLAWAAGTVALIKSVYPRIGPGLVARALALSASYHPRGGYNTTIGFGLINPIGALRAAGRLLKLRPAARAGPRVEKPTAYFGKPVTGVVSAVRHAPVLLAGFGALVLAGLALLTAAFRLSRRARRSRRSGRRPTTPEGAMRPA